MRTWSVGASRSEINFRFVGKKWTLAEIISALLRSSATARTRPTKSLTGWTAWVSSEARIVRLPAQPGKIAFHFCFLAQIETAFRGGSLACCCCDGCGLVLFCWFCGVVARRGGEPFLAKRMLMLLATSVALANFKPHVQGAFRRFRRPVQLV